MVVGSHPHVIQTMENYKGKLIAYSFGNFCFGGNSNPWDKRTFILQGKFNLENGDIKKIEYKVIPTLISSVEDRND
jgi:poly-gamma-glutamate synthesis protein (capsule biosynthesis protein)